MKLMTSQLRASDCLWAHLWARTQPNPTSSPMQSAPSKEWTHAYTSVYNRGTAWAIRLKPESLQPTAWHPKGALAPKPRVHRYHSPVHDFRTQKIIGCVVIRRLKELSQDRCVVFVSVSFTVVYGERNTVSQVRRAPGPHCALHTPRVKPRRHVKAARHRRGGGASPPCFYHPAQ